MVLLGAAASADPYCLPDAELLNAEFGPVYGSGSLITRLDVPGPGVVFSLTLGGSIGLGDPWPTASAAGLKWDDGLHHYTSLADYSSYQMTVSYVQGPANSDINVGLFLNTGLTGDSGFPSNDPDNDTWWGGQWVTLALGQTARLVLDFTYAQVYNAHDNDWPHSGTDPVTKQNLGWADGSWQAINDRDRHEISNIGIQIADFDSDTLGQTIGVHLNAIPEPFSMAFMGAAFACVAGWRLRERAKRARGLRGT